MITTSAYVPKIEDVEIENMIMNAIRSWRMENRGHHPHRIIISYESLLVMRASNYFRAEMQNLSTRMDHRDFFTGIPLYAAMNVDHNFIEVS